MLIGKNKWKMGKKALCLIFTFLFSINSFAAVVSDNDGAAFITKAEFEAMKKDFNDQIDNYNASIDNKIDGAIASYLAGINISKNTSKNIIFNDWIGVTSHNFDIGNTWQPIHGFFAPSIIRYRNDNAGVVQCSWQWADLETNRSTSNKAQVMLVDAGEESSTAPNIVTWKGISYDYEDIISISWVRQYYRMDSATAAEAGGWFWNMDWTRIHMCNWAALKPGYWTDLSSNVDNIWGGRYYLYNTGTASGPIATIGYFKYNSTNSRSVTTSIDVKKIPSLDRYYYEHIIDWSNIDTYRVHDSSWTHTLSYNPVLTRNDLTLKTSKGSWSGIESNGTKRYVSTLDGVWRGNYNTNSDTTQLVTVGLLNKTYNSTDIYQFSKPMNIESASKSYTLEKINLTQGLGLLAADEKEKVTWEPQFINRYVDGTRNDFEVNIKFSTSPFGNGDSTIESDVIKCDTPTQKQQSIVTTTNGKVKVEFEMPKDGIVYCKWWPSDTSIQSQNWTVDLDVENCNTYISEKA